MEKAPLLWIKGEAPPNVDPMLYSTGEGDGLRLAAASEGSTVRGRREKAGEEGFTVAAPLAPIPVDRNTS